jgi:hypothetical protein
MIENPKIGQRVFVYSFVASGFVPGHVARVHPASIGCSMLVNLAPFEGAIERRQEHCYTEDEALALSLQLAAGQWRPA